MTVRTGMATLINTVRGFANAGLKEWQVGTATYWSDEEIERVLDRHKTEHRRQSMEAVLGYENGQEVCKKYRTNETDIESGIGAFKIEDETGEVSGWTMDYAAGVATFAIDQQGKALFWTGFSYDLRAAASEIWQIKASHAAEMVDFSTDGHSVKRSHLVSSYLKMAEFYANTAKTKPCALRTVKIERDDV